MRRLAVIVHADVKDSSALVQRDETLAHRRIVDAFRRFSQTIHDYGGTAREVRGDALLATFDRASDAVSASLVFQAENDRRNADLDDDIRPHVRIGIAMGEVVVADGTLTGPDVVMAQRIEQLAEPGGICVHATVHDTIPRRMPFQYTDRGEQDLKGFDALARVYGVRLPPNASVPPPESDPMRGRTVRRRLLAGGLVALAVAVGGVFAWLQPWWDDVTPADPKRMAFALPDRPSIAVLPFKNLSADPQQAFFAEGIAEDIITDLSKISGLFVVARNASFSYKDEPVQIGRVAEALGVRYVLEGSVRREANRIRVTTQLIDALKGAHLWSERFDRELTDVFAIQSEIAGNVSKALAVTIKAGEHERLFLKHTTSIEAYELFLQARRLVDAVGKEPVERAEAMFQRVVELDPNFADAYAGLSFNYSVKARFGFTDTPVQDAERALDYARKAIDLDKELAWGYIALGGAYLASGDANAAVDAMRQALVIQPNGYEANLFMGLYLQFAGNAARAVEHLELAQRLNPVDTERKLAFLGFAYFMNGDYEKSAAIFTRRMDKLPIRNELNYVFLAASHAMLGRETQAAQAAEMVLRLNPEFELSGWTWIRAYTSLAHRQRLYDAAKLAGVPEHRK